MNRVTIRSRMHWMPTSVRLNSILQMSTSKLAYNYSAAVSPMEWRFQRVRLRHSHKMSILKLIKSLEPLDLQDPNGAMLLRSSRRLQGPKPVQLETGEEDLPRSIHLLNLQTHTIRESRREALSLRHLEYQVHDKISK